MTDLTAYLATITTVVQSIMALFASVLDFILSSPILAVPAAVSILLLVVGVVRSFIYGQR